MYLITGVFWVMNYSHTVQSFHTLSSADLAETTWSGREEERAPGNVNSSVFIFICRLKVQSKKTLSELAATDERRVQCGSPLQTTSAAKSPAAAPGNNGSVRRGEERRREEGEERGGQTECSSCTPRWIAQRGMMGRGVGAGCTDLGSDQDEGVSPILR